MGRWPTGPERITSRVAINSGRQCRACNAAAARRYKDRRAAA